MVWDLMSANGVGDVVEIDGIMNADRSARFRSTMWYHDSDSKYNVSAVKAYLD